LVGFDPDLGAVTPTVLAAFWNGHKKFKNNQNNTNPSRCVMLCDLVSRKNNKLGILQLLWKSVHKKELSHTKFHGFQAKWDSYGHNHGIVCSNNPILCKCVHLGMSNIVHFGCFPFLGIKSSFFIFLAQKMAFLWSTYQNYVSKIYLDNFRKYYTIFYAQWIICLHGKGFIATPQEIDKYLSIQLEAGQIWPIGAS
jgi:hypothetical protein